MTNWTATTETGTTYEWNGHTVRITSARDGVTVIRPWQMQSAPEVPDLQVPWAYLDHHRRAYGDEQMSALDIDTTKYNQNPTPWVPVTEPVIGQRLYVGGKDEWRISTLITKIEYTG